MQKIKDAIKIILIYSLKQILKLLWIFPVHKKRILFNSFTGKQYSDNPKYMFLDLYNKYGKEIEYVWVRNVAESELDGFENVHTVRFLSMNFIFAMLTCAVYVTNCSVEPFIPKRKKQLFICSWHGGGAYKKLSHFYKQRKSFEIMSKTRSQMTDYYTSACGLFTHFIAPDWWADGRKFLESGMPRNDILLKENKNIDRIASIKERLGIPQEKKIVLYAPTMRGWAVHPNDFSLTLDVEKLLAALNERFGGEFLFLFRCHHVMLNKMHVSDNIHDVSAYNDMQELLLISDVLVTDYSSSIWDFSLTFRPCFLFTPDLQEYEDYQSFYVPISEWPFSYARTNEELCQLVGKFDKDVYTKKVNTHHSQLQSFERGNATRFINEKIEAHLERI